MIIWLIRDYGESQYILTIEEGTHLVVDVRNIHNKIDLESEIISQNPPHNVLSHVVPGDQVSHQSLVSDLVGQGRGHTSHGPYEKHRKLSVHSCTRSRLRVSSLQTRPTRPSICQ